MKNSNFATSTVCIKSFFENKNTKKYNWRCLKSNRGMAYSFYIKKVFLVFVLITLVISGISIKSLANTTPKVEDSEYIYLDLALGHVTLSNTRYQGTVYENGVATVVSGDINKKIYIYQSNGDATVWENGLPKYSRVGAPTDSGKTNWSDYITNNTALNDIITNWNIEAAKVNRSSTPYRVSNTGTNSFDVTIDNLWSSYHKKGTSRTDGGISFMPTSNAVSSATIRLKGDNRFGNIFYHSKSATSRQIIFEGIDNGSVTLANLAVGADKNTNYWNSALGGNDSNNGGDARGIIINGGILFAGTTYEDNCTAIGGGGNDFGDITINGGVVTAVAHSTGTAIGGGIGYNSSGGNADVKITGGTVYAYNFGYEGVPAAAIGGGSSSASNGNSSTTITITGGNVYAESVGGTAVGGGSSKTQNGGPATINIGGDAVVIAKSVQGEYNAKIINAGAAIGGGTGGTNSGKYGGNATVNIYGNAKLYTGSIGGGKTNNSTGKIGNATITIKDNPTIQGQFIMAAGASNPCSFEMSGGTIDNSNVQREYTFLQEYGGAVYIENGDADMTGGTIKGCSAVNGGAVYVSGGNFTMDGGTISNNTASENGGAIYVNEGNFTMTSGTISNNNASNEGGAIYLIGGDIAIGLESCLGDDSTHIHPVVSNNIAQNNGGGLAVNGGTIRMYCGGMENNQSVTNQSSNSVGQSGGVFEIAGGDLGIGVNVSGGEFTDNRDGIYQMRYYTIYDDVSESVLVALENNKLILPNETDANLSLNTKFDRRANGLWIIGWSTDPNSTDGYIPMGDRISVTQNTELYAVYGDEEPIPSYVVTIPDSIEFEYDENARIKFSATMKYITNIAEIGIKLIEKNALVHTEHSSVELEYDLIDETEEYIDLNDSIYLRRENEKEKYLMIEIAERVKYSGTYTDTLTFEVSYDDGL